MKKRGDLWAVLLAALALVFGFLLPQGVAAVQDRSAGALRDSFETEDVTLSFVPELTIEEKVALGMRSISYSYALPEGKILNRQTADAAAAAVVDELSRWGLSNPSDTYRISNVYPMLNIYENGSSFLVWYCTAGDDLGNYMDMYLDDETGKPIAFTRSMSEGPVSLESTYALGQCLTECFGYDRFEINQYDDSGAAADLTFYDADGNPTRTTLYMDSYYITFNF